MTVVCKRNNGNIENVELNVFGDVKKIYGKISLFGKYGTGKLNNAIIYNSIDSSSKSLEIAKCSISNTLFVGKLANKIISDSTTNLCSLYSIGEYKDNTFCLNSFDNKIWKYDCYGIPSFDDNFILEDGKEYLSLEKKYIAQYDIVIPKNASDMITFSANEIYKYIKEALNVASLKMGRTDYLS